MKEPNTFRNLFLEVLDLFFVNGREIFPKFSQYFSPNSSKEDGDRERGH